MKIEKINDNQIRCTLTQQDLENRHIRLSELAYGTEKANLLFHDMIQQANYEFGFEADDLPLMIEAIPVSPEAIILLITKVEYPEELDTRFSKFSNPPKDYENYDDDDMEDIFAEGADDILGLFKKIAEEKNASSEDFDKSLFKDVRNHTYYLILHKSSLSPEVFNKVCNILAEYANQGVITSATEAYYTEHHTILCRHNALQTFAQL